MNIKNYTSTVSVDKSVAHIERRLVDHGAHDILKIYENKRLEGIAFIATIEGQKIPFRIPARVENVRKAMISELKRPRTGNRGRVSSVDRASEQAERTAWKLLSDWVDVQMSLLELDQAKFMEVFLPYVYDHDKKRTLFERMESSGFKNLLVYTGK